MFFEQPMIIHSQRADGRHWLTSIDFPPLQILPIEGNQCRVGYSLALLVSSCISKLDSNSLNELCIIKDDLINTPDFEHRFDIEKVSNEEILLNLEMKPAPLSDGTEDENYDDVEFITLLPPKDYKGTYDQWIFDITLALGMEPPIPMNMESYDEVMNQAIKKVKVKIPELRDRFLSGLNGLNMGLKIALSTDSGGKEYVWVTPTNWDNEREIMSILESEPYECSKYIYGQELQISIDDILDYVLGSEEGGLVEPGFTQQIAEDYGVVVY